MTVEQEVRDINATRHLIWARAKEVLDRAAKEGRGLTAEENINYDKASKDLDRLDTERWDLITSSRAKDELETVNSALRAVSTPSERARATGRESAVLRDFFRPLRAPGQYNAIEFNMDRAANLVEYARAGADEKELRAVLQTDGGASGGSLTVPTMVAPTIYAYMTAQTAMRRTNTTVINTDSGAPMVFPRVTTHGIGTQVASQTTAFTGTDPVIGQMTLNAYDFGQLMYVANDMLEDAGVDVLGFVASNVGRSVGQYSGTKYISGSGTGEPMGVMTALGGAGTIATGGSLLLGPAGQEVEKLIDVQYSVADSYKLVNGGCSWLMKDTTGAKLRKLRDGAGGTIGSFLWSPSPTRGALDGQPDSFMGDPVYFDVNVAGMGSDAKIIAYGNFSAYYVRDVRGFRLERSDDLKFAENQAAFRGLLRSDGDLIDSNALNVLHQAVS